MKKHSGGLLNLFVILGTMGLVLETQAQNSGIGTNTPASRLHVVGSTSNSSTSSFQVQNSTSPTPLIFVRDDGKVGIGTNSPTYRFQVNGRAINPSINEYGQVAAFQDTTGNFKTFFSLNAPGGSWSPLTVGGDNGIFWTDDGVIESNNGFVIAPHSSLRKGIRIDGPTGYVGIGGFGVGAGSGSVPAARLESFESTNLGAAVNDIKRNLTLRWFVDGNQVMNNVWMRRKSTTSGWNGIVIHDGISVDLSFLSPGVDTKTWWERDPFGNIQSWGNENVTQMTLNSGKLGIGTTTPGSLLSIANGASDPVNYGKAFQITNANGASQQMAFIRAGNNVISAGYKGTNPIWGFGGGQTDDASFAPNLLAFDLSSGKTGISTTAPTSRLEVNGSFGFKTTTPAPAAFATPGYTLGDEAVVIVNVTTNTTFLVNLPTAAGITGRVYIIKRVTGPGVTTGTAVVQCTGGQLLDGVSGLSSKTLADRESLTVVSNGTTWFVIN